jgi:hypothetical protein
MSIQLRFQNSAHQRLAFASAAGSAAARLTASSFAFHASTEGSWEVCAQNVKWCERAGVDSSSYALNGKFAYSPEEVLAKRLWSPESRPPKVSPF